MITNRALFPDTVLQGYQNQNRTNIHADPPAELAKVTNRCAERIIGTIVFRLVDCVALDVIFEGVIK